MTDRATAEPRPFDPALHELVVKTIKGLAMDAVQQAQSGHPGMPMGMAGAAAVLWTQHLVHDPARPDWIDRDRFVLSAGHGSMLLYALLHVSGYDLPLDELRRFRQWGSRTPGHPEHGLTPGVEVTTGPLGTGFSAGVGMALAERFLAERYNRSGHTVVDHFTFGIVSDGDLMEGVASEAASLAGHWGLGKLVYLYDQNGITIDGSTELSFTEDVAARFGAYGWHVQSVDGHDPGAVSSALAAARRERARPSLIACRTVIGHGAPSLAGSEKTHGAPLGVAEVEATKKAMGWPTEPFHVPAQVRQAASALAEQLAKQREAWEQRLAAYRRDDSALADELVALAAGTLPAGALAAIPSFPAGGKLATRKANNKVLAALVDAHPTLVGGSADLTGSNGVELPKIGIQSRNTPAGRFLHFGVREHGMAAICNGLALHGGLRVFDATFLVFSDFMRGALRLSALMELPVIHVFSHESFWLGEDGPTHQPIEHVMSLRAIPNLHVIRPADARETAVAWAHALARTEGPTAILVSRQDLPILEGTGEDAARGAYVVFEPPGATVPTLDGLLVATGSEVWMAIEAARTLAAEGRPVRVVSMPCWEAFEAQPAAYRDAVLPLSVTRRLSVEAGVSLGWSRWAAAQHAIDRFGASAPAGELAERFGFTPTAIAAHYRTLA
jgi:transketolase